MSEAQGEAQSTNPDTPGEASAETEGHAEDVVAAKGLLALKDHPEMNVEIQSSVYAKWADGEIKECIVVDIRSKGEVTEYCLHIPDCIPPFFPFHSYFLSPFFFVCIFFASLRFCFIFVLHVQTVFMKLV